MKKFLNRYLILLLVLSLATMASGCSRNEKTASTEKVKKTSQTANENKGNSQKEVNDFVIKNTKIVKVFSINRRVNPKTPDLGPLFVVRGIDERGQQSEVWVKDNKIYEMSIAN
jgi:hypothetical protein